MGKRTVVLHLSGKAERVFSLLDYYARNWGQLTLGQILARSQGKRFPTFVSR